MIPIKHFAAFVGLVGAGVVGAATAPAPTDLVALLAKAKIELPIASWCRGDFESGISRAYAVAALSPTGGGQYLVLGMNGKVIELAPFTGGVDLACYSPAEAKELNRSLAGNTVVHGGVTPVWSTTVICGFVENTNAVCWQYSPKARAFVKVGEWVT